ncbi:MAG: sigma-70 family RNA polymerase sigma factor, partial [Candidatus Colwellbacteria bacterium]|nr:sigma-70 family RNA polymerase sigma factor [Candidatus Colwellbacteria bacterium]
LYDHYLPPIYRFVLFRVSHREEAEDITHQTFLKAWERIDQYEPRGHSFGSWLYRIARNTVIDTHRKRSPYVSIDEITVHLSVEQSQSEFLDTKIEWEMLLTAIGELKDVEQEVLFLRFVEDLSHQETGKVIGKSEGAVKLVQHRALKNLKSILKKMDSTHSASSEQANSP